MRPAKIDKRMAEEGFIPAQRAADIVGVHLTTIYRAAEDGVIKGRRMGRYWYVHAKSVAECYQFPGLADAMENALRKVLVA